LKRRIVVSIVGVAVIAVMLLGVPLALAVEQFYAKQQVLYLDREAGEANRQIGSDDIKAGTAQIHDKRTTRLAVYNARGVKLSGTGPDRADQPVARALDGDTGDGHNGRMTVVAVPVYENGRVVGAIRASEPRRFVVTQTLWTWAVMGLLALVALVVATLLARHQSRRLTRPIDDLVDAAERLGGGDFSVHPEPSGVPELDRVGAALDSTAERLGALVDRERSFTADASHQLRTPIAGLRVGIEGALMTPGRDARAALEEALVPLDQLEATVNDLLALARHPHAERYPLDLDRVLSALTDDWHRRPDRDGRGIVVEIESDLPHPLVAEAAIRQILRVLIDNAALHGAGDVTLRSYEVPGGIAIDVRDEGPGLADSDGMGLTLARRLAEAEGGRLRIEHAGPAPVFRLLLPVEGHEAASNTGENKSG
jgi:signal transduction histidine kinase